MKYGIWHIYKKTGLEVEASHSYVKKYDFKIDKWGCGFTEDINVAYKAREELSAYYLEHFWEVREKL